MTIDLITKILIVLYLVGILFFAIQGFRWTLRKMPFKHWYPKWYGIFLIVMDAILWPYTIIDVWLSVRREDDE